MTYQFEAPIACTEALVTAVEERNDFGQYTLTILGINQNGCYTNKGTVTINKEELQPLLQEKELSFPKGIIGQRVKVISHEKLRNRRRQHFSRRSQKTAKKSTWNFERGYFYEADFCTYLQLRQQEVSTDGNCLCHPMQKHPWKAAACTGHH